MAEDQTLIILLVVGLLGIGGAIIYYFGRYAFKTDQEGKLDQGSRSSEANRVGETRRSGADLDVATNESKIRDKSKDKSSDKNQGPISAVSPSTIGTDLQRPEQAEPKESSKSFLAALSITKDHLFGRIQRAFSSSNEKADLIEAVEEILFTSDIGPRTVTQLMASVESLKGTLSLEELRRRLKDEMKQILAKGPLGLDGYQWQQWDHKIDSLTGPFVLLVVGVNGAGKTTSIGKVAHHFASNGKKVLVAAGDTFRAGAGQQLKAWSDRAQVEIYSPEEVKDPSAVAFDACQKGVAKGFDVVIIDTAGRLHTQKNLMEELKKMKRVIQKVIPEAPHETLLVLDANSGQNALIQAAQFHEAVGVSGVLLTKLDGTAKGGVVLGLAYELGLPIYLAGVGEKMTDLKEFKPREFIDSII